MVFTELEMNHVLRGAIAKNEVVSNVDKRTIVGHFWEFEDGPSRQGCGGFLVGVGWGVRG